MSMAGGPFKTPVVPSSTHGRTNQRVGMNQETTDSVPRFLVIKKISNEDFAKDSPFVIDKTIYGLVGRVKDVRKTREGLLVETVSIPQSLRLLKVEKLGDTPVEVVPHKTLNYSKGVITCRDFLNCELDEILEGLKEIGVVEIKRITTRREGFVVNTASLILTFNTPNLPSSIKAAFYSLKVRPYIPAPLRCFRCQGFGHVSARCDKEQTCVCGLPPHEGSQCKTPITCVNCGGTHSARAKNCPIFQEEQAIQRLKVEQKITFSEARRKVKESVPAVQMSYAQAAQIPKQAYDTQHAIKQLIPDIVNICTAVIQGKPLPDLRSDIGAERASTNAMNSSYETRSITSEKRKKYTRGIPSSGEDGSESELSQLSQSTPQSPAKKKKPGRPPKLKSNTPSN